jgi:hypothetical protein
MCVDVCGDVCVMCVDVVEMQAMAPMAPKLWHQSATRTGVLKTHYNRINLCTFNLKIL